MFDRLGKLEQGQAAILEKQDSFSQNIVRIENNYGNKLSALFDAREVQFDVNDRMLDTLNRIEHSC